MTARHDPTETDAAAVAGPAAGVLVIGYGNPLRSDDGVGPAVAERLAADPRLRDAEIRAEHQLTPEVAIDASRVALLVLVDADDSVPAGEVVVRELGAASGTSGALAPTGRDAQGGQPLTHFVDPASLLALAAELWGAVPRTVVVGIGPLSLGLGDELTPEVAAAVPRAVEAVVAVVEAARTAEPAATARTGGPVARAEG